MKTMKNILNVMVLLAVVWSCEDNNFDNVDFVDSALAPANVSALFGVTQDNTGLVTITPNSEGAASYSIYYGDNTSEPETVPQGESTMHTYAEGSYSIRIVAIGLGGKTSEATLPLEVSFKAPDNLEVIITNDEAVSKQVNVTATADDAISFDVYFGEEGSNEPVSGNIGETVSYAYAEAGTYTIRVIAKGSAIETTEYSQEFEAVAIVQPIVSATTPPTRDENDVVSVYTSKYKSIADTDFNPDWGQSGQGSGYAEFDLNGDTMLQYISLSYQGVQFAAEVDLTAMEYLHMDVWTADVTTIETSLISATNGEKPVVSELTADQWTSIDIPISDFTDQGLTVADIHQLKFVGEPWASGTVFIDNIYFYKPSSATTLTIENFEGTAPIFTDFGNALTAIVENPDATEVNTSLNVAQLTKPSGAETWAGSFIELSGPIDLDTYSKIGVKIWSPKSGAVVKLKLENADASVTHEVDLTTLATNAWEELEYDFSTAPEGEFVKIVIFFDFGAAGDDSAYYFDDYTLIN